jgi:hypothetical protein
MTTAAVQTLTAALYRSNNEVRLWNAAGKFIAAGKVVAVSTTTDRVSLVRNGRQADVVLSKIDAIRVTR